MGIQYIIKFFLYLLWPYIKESFLGDKTLREWITANKRTTIWLAIIIFMFANTIRASISLYRTNNDLRIYIQKVDDRDTLAKFQKQTILRQGERISELKVKLNWINQHCIANFSSKFKDTS